MTDEDDSGGEVFHLDDMEFEGPNVEIPDPPAHLAYEEIEDWRSLQILALNGIGDDEESLTKALDTENGVLLSAAAHACWRYRAAAPALARVADSREDDNAAVEAANALARQGQPNGVERLRRGLQLPLGPYMSPILAAGYLAQLGDPRGFATVREGLGNEFRTVRMLACKQLYFFLPHHGETTPLGDTVDVAALFTEALADEEPVIRDQALGELRRSDSPEARALLQRADFGQRRPLPGN